MRKFEIDNVKLNGNIQCEYWDNWNACLYAWQVMIMVHINCYLK